MPESRNHFVFEFLVLLCCISFRNVSGIKIMLTRDNEGDYFTNPYNDKCRRFTNAKCFKNYPKQGDQCGYCKCDKKKTFNETSLHCVAIRDFGKGCRPMTNLKGDEGQPLDLTKDDDTKLLITSAHKVKSVRILSMNGIRVDFFSQKQIEKMGERWVVEIEWEKVPKEMYYGQVFRVQISYQTHNNVEKNDCFVFKFKGNMTVTIQDLTTTPPLPLANEKTTIQTSPSHVVSHAAVTISNLTTTAPSPSAIEKSTAQILPSRTVPSTTTITTASPTKIPIKNTDPVSVTIFKISTPTVSSSDQFNSTNDTRKKKSSDGRNNAVVVSLTIVGCLLLLGVVILAVLWFRRRSKRTSEDKSGEISLKNGNVENHMKMSQPASIYAEAESSITSPDKDEDNHEYDYADGNLKNYASLDTTKVESKPVYQSLINVEKDLNKHIPSESGETSTAEPFYHVVEGEDGNQDPGQVYHVLEDPEKSDNCETKDALGRTGHENPVYSTLEEDAPETYDREVSEGTGDDNPERVYSVLEN